MFDEMVRRRHYKLFLKKGFFFLLADVYIFIDFIVLQKQLKRPGQ